MLTKEQIIATIQAMPGSQFEDIDVVIEQLIILEKIERGMQDIEEGNVIAHEDLKKEVDAWFKK